jgi:hypothetical protein
MAAASKGRSEVSRNYEAFVRKLPKLLSTHRGKFALMHRAEIVDFCDSAGDAYKIGVKRFGEGEFSVQEVTDLRADLGFFSHAGTQR